MKKVIVRLGNGLGNQLFTYAAAYSFAKKNKARLYVDDESGFYKRYKYELHNFNISALIAEKKYKFLGFSGRAKRKIFIKISKFNSEYAKRIIEMWSKEDIDYWIAVLQHISDEAYSNPEIVTTAPHNQAIHKLNPESLDDPDRWAMTWRAFKRKQAARRK